MCRRIIEDDRRCEIRTHGNNAVSCEEASLGFLVFAVTSKKASRGKMKLQWVCRTDAYI